MDLAPDALVVLTIGRRAPQKGDRYLLDAWPQVVAGHPRAVLVLVGDGPLEAEVQAQAAALGIAASVRFLGRVPQAARLLGLADIFVLPSIFEGLPYALLEAMALGRACLASNIAGVREVLRAGET
ncbi:MAG TPA: glycosyltransferase family 4 protein, partial [Armatimonadetes bacterium]|nr:glycosyltransferase family 4 protein [Armatimonadota bacterium]